MDYSWLALGLAVFRLLLLEFAEGEINIVAGSGIVTSPAYPNWYPSDHTQDWRIRSAEGTHVRIRFLFLQMEESDNCIADSISIYDDADWGAGLTSLTPLGQFCGAEIPPMLESSSSVITVRFVSDFKTQDLGFAFSYEVVDIPVGSRIVWTEVHPESGMVRLNSLPADPLAIISPAGNLLPHVAPRNYYQVPRGRWRAVATNYGQQRVIWSDQGETRIYKGTLGEYASARPFFTATSDNVNGIAVDWMTGNVYWTDATYDWILVFNSEGTRYDIVVDEGLDVPGGIAVHPIRGLLFWTDAGMEPKVERSNMAGGNRVLLATTDVVAPRGITVDYDTNKVYWVDADPRGNRVEVCDITGENRRQLYYTPSNDGFFDLTIFKNFLYVTGETTSTLHLLRKDTGQLAFDLNVTLKPYGIVTYAPDTQPPAVSHCSSNPCSYMCVGGGMNGYTCLCGSGKLLASDGRTCRDEGAISPPSLFVASRSRLCYYPSFFPDMVIPENYTVSCMLTNRRHAVALAVDLEDGLVFYSDVARKTIGKARLRGGSPVQYITGSTSSVEGMAVDWLTKTLYWTDNPRGTIEVCRYDGSYRKVLVQDQVLRPRSIAIDPQEKVMFWTEFGPPAQIERASLDGTGRVEIVSAGLTLSRPSGLVIDYGEKRLYYGDVGSGTIYSVDYTGRDQRQIIQKPGASFFELALFKDYIMWTELGQNSGIFVANRETGQPVRALTQREQVYGITMYADTRQTVAHNPCRSNNGGCSQLCLNSQLMSRGYVCACTVGFFLGEDDRSCLSNTINNDFLLLTDSYRRSIYQVDLSANFKPEAIPLTGVRNPIGVAFDPVGRMVYWTDVDNREINRASLGGSAQETIASQNIGQPNGIAMDPISRLVYWTDLVQRSISVATLDGTHRKVLITDLSKPWAIVLHPVEGIMFWSDWRTDAAIERSYMDGNMRRVIVTGGLMWPNGLTIDVEGNRLYWCDGGVDRVESSDFSGHDRRVLVDSGAGHHAFGIAVSDQFMFWTDWQARSLLRADKLTGRGNVSVGQNHYLRPNAMFLVTNETFETGINSCSEGNGGCSRLCLPTAIGRTCACADGVELAPDGVTCMTDLNIECPLEFNYGGVDESCDRSPGSNCSVMCFSGHVPTISHVICRESGRWNVPQHLICIEEQCGGLPTPAHAVAGPCRPPYEMGTLCMHQCEPGHIRTAGDARRVCSHGGEWLGSPITCEVAPTEPNQPAGCAAGLAFVRSPEDSSPAENDLVQQYCTVNTAEVEITWYKDGARLVSGSVEGVYVLPTNDLLIPGFEATHEGHYACVASLAGHECLRKEVELVFDPHRHFDAVPSNASLDAGDHHLFECHARSPLDSVTWFKDGTQLVQTDQIIQLGFGILLRNLVVTDSGRYTCVVNDQTGNPRGEAEAWLRVTEQVEELPNINITEVCGLVTAPEALDLTTTSPNDPRVVGGQRARHGSAPYMGRIYHKSERSFICGATLLNQRWVLTAAHCITLYELHHAGILVYFGDHDTLSTEDSQVVAEADEIIQHEDFNNVTFDRDIALIRLKQPFASFTDYIRPVCLPPGWLAKQLLATDNMGRVTGWGQIAEGGPYPRYLTEVYLPVVKLKKCKEGTRYDVTKYMFCAGYARVEKDACQGDSGGPFAMMHENRWYQTGIVSWGEGCAREGKYGYYTKILRFLGWIERHIST